MTKRIYFILPSLLGGGAEKVVLTLLKHIDKRKFDPTLVLLNTQGSYSVPDDISVINLDVQRARYGIFKVAKLLRKERPDIVFSTLGYLNLLMAIIRPFFSKKIRFIARESNTVSLENQTERFSALFDFLYRKFYNNFDAIITQSHYMKKDLMENYQVLAEKITMIYNPVDIEAIAKNMRQKPAYTLPTDKINLLAVGRLSPQKGFDILIKSISLLDDNYHLSILGEGEDEESLKALVKTYGIENRVSFAGFQHNPHAIMKACDLFVLSSRYEGLPNVLLEANACGLGAVAFNTPGGTAEIIEHKVNALLVNECTSQALADAIEEASKIAFDSQKIKQMIEERFAVNKIIAMYESVFCQT